MALSDVVVCDATAFRVLAADGLVLRARVRVTRDDVPGVDEAGEVAETAEGDVDEGVGGAETGFYPYC